MADMEVSEGQGPPTRKDQKYDRQLRLWGARGQKALAEGRILLINAGPTGTEIMKNLVLPGAGNFVVVDGKRVTKRDLQNNFFVKPDCLGAPRARVVTELLVELNPDAHGEYKAVTPESIIRGDPSFFASFNLVIATQMEQGPLLELSGLLWELGVPLLVARSYGLMGYLRVQIKDHTIVDAKVNEDLRGYYNLSLAKPLPGLQAIADATTISELSSAELARVPYVVLLLKARALWHERFGPAAPANFSEKQEFAELIKSLAIDPGEGNFEEALKVPYLAFSPVAMPDAVQALLADPRADGDPLPPDTPDFWVVVRALRDFVANEGEGRLPLSGSIPDMTSSTANFTQLQRLYKAQGDQDKAVMAARVASLLESSGRSPSSIPPEDLELYCRNAFSLRAIRTRSLAEEYSSPALEAVASALEDGYDYPSPDLNPILWYMGLRAVDRFQTRRGYYPGVKTASLAADEDELWLDLQEVAKSMGALGGNGVAGDGEGEGEAMEVEPPVRKDHAVEMARYGACELHNIAAILGGIGSQEAVKILTQQYVPIDHTFIYHAIGSVGAQYAI